MKKKFLSVFLLVTLALSLYAVAVPAFASEPKVVVHLKGALEPDLQLEAAMNNISWVEWSVVYGEITASDLSGAVMLIMVQADSSLDYADAELSAVKSWLDEGGKTVWIAADSDYGTDSLRQATANSALEYFGSVLRIEQASVEDPVSNGGAPYRVLAVSDNVDPMFAHLVSGVDRGLFHGPAPIVGYVDGEYYKLEEETPGDVYVIMTTSVNGILVDNSEPMPGAHMAGDEGTFPTMAIEVDYDKKNVLIATGDAPFGQYTGLYKPELRRADRYGIDANPQQGGRLFENVIDYATQYSVLMIDSANSIEAKDTEITSLESDISSLESDKSSLEGEVSSLTSQVSSLEGDVSDLEDQAESLGAQISSLEGQVTDLEADLASAKSSASSWQMYAVAALVIGAVVGFFLGPMLKK
ncbi:MAG: hypothetical protein PVJ38_04345 [Candidatus Bathyarchaeota archaeon]